MIAGPPTIAQYPALALLFCSSYILNAINILMFLYVFFFCSSFINTFPFIKTLSVAQDGCKIQWEIGNGIYLCKTI